MNYDFYTTDSANFQDIFYNGCWVHFIFIVGVGLFNYRRLPEVYDTRMCVCADIMLFSFNGKKSDRFAIDTLDQISL